MLNTKGAWWGPKGPIVWQGSFTWQVERYMLVMACADLTRCASLDESFDEVACYLRRGESEFASEYGDKLMSAVVVFGTDAHVQQLEALHASYNRMWQRNPELWERIEARGCPTTLWLIDLNLSPRYGIIQPAMEGAFEVLSAPDLRQTLRYDCYNRSADPVWRIAVIPIRSEEIEGAWRYWTTKRQAAPGAAPDPAGM